MRRGGLPRSVLQLSGMKLSFPIRRNLANMCPTVRSRPPAPNRNPIFASQPLPSSTPARLPSFPSSSQRHQPPSLATSSLLANPKTGVGLQRYHTASPPLPPEKASSECVDCSPAQNRSVPCLPDHANLSGRTRLFPLHRPVAHGFDYCAWGCQPCFKIKQLQVICEP